MHDLKRILGYLKPYKKELIITLLLVVVETFFELIIPFLMKDIIDIGIEQGNIREVMIIGMEIIGCAIISLVTGHFYSRYNAKLVTHFSYHLREEAFKKIQDFSFSNLDHFHTTSLITRVTNDVMIMQNTLAGGLRPLTRSPMMLLMGIGLSFIMAPQIAWIFICFVPILAIILFFIVRTVAPQYSVMQQNLDNLNGVVRENVTAIRTVKSYVREDYEEEKFDKANKKVMDTTKFTFRIAQLNQPSFQFVMYGVTVAILYFGSKLVNKGDLAVGTLSALLSYILQVVNSLMMFSNVFLLVNRSFASSKRLCEIFDEQPDIKSNGSALEIVESGKIDFNHVYFKYKAGTGEYVLSDIDLHIKAGESIGILGGTGSSKSTLVSLISRLYDVTEGSIFIDDKNIKDFDLVNLRDSISIVLQNNVLFSGSIRENLLWGDPNASDEEILNACHIACVDEFLDRLSGGLDYDLGQGGVNVSGGQKQRLCIARALLKKPKVIIFDDSTSACDMETERKIMRGIRSLKNVTNIVIGQRITSVMDADRIIILDDGKIVNIGNHDELLKNSSIYKELYDAQLGGVLDGSNAK